MLCDGSEMKIKKFCPYCGKMRTYTTSYEDYHTVLGVSSNKTDPGCDCLLGRLKHASGKIQIKKQCANCAYNKGGRCINEQERNDVSALFGIENLVIKDESKHCIHYELSKDIFDTLIKLTE